jgi:diguanylate cyclase (GGDEF)-like protein/PAS domain S-box-containing protein
VTPGIEGVLHYSGLPPKAERSKSRVKIKKLCSSCDLLQLFLLQNDLFQFDKRDVFNTLNRCTRVRMTNGHMNEVIPGGVDNAFSFMVDHVSDYAIFLLNTEGIVLTWNKAAAKMKGYAAEEIIGQFFGLLYTEDDRLKTHPRHNLNMAAANGTFQEETWRRKKDGSLFWAMVEIIAIKSPSGELSGFCKLTRDITGLKDLQDKVAAEKERAEVTLHAIGDAVISTDAEGKIESLNPKAEQLTGWKVTEALGRPFSEVFHVLDEGTLHPHEHELTAMLKQGELIAAKSPAVLRNRNGTNYAIEDAVAPIRLPDGRTTGGVIVFRDVTQSRKLLKTVTHQATHDSLTGLVNRREFENRLARSLSRAQQVHSTGAVLFIDLDNFKTVNDTFGHEAGDALLKQLSAMYSHVIRDRDTLARLGGDEFAIIADHCSQNEAYAIASKILHSTRDFRFGFGDRVVQVGVSIGLATFDARSGNGQEIVRHADTACYVAKRSGRNQIRLSTDNSHP